MSHRLLLRALAISLISSSEPSLSSSPDSSAASPHLRLSRTECRSLTHDLYLLCTLGGRGGNPKPDSDSSQALADTWSHLSKRRTHHVAGRSPHRDHLPHVRASGHASDHSISGHKSGRHVGGMRLLKSYEDVLKSGEIGISQKSGSIQNDL